MHAVRRLLLLVILLTGGLAPVARATTPPAELESDTLFIELKHHWVVELAGQRFGLIEFDTPMTTVLLGGLHFDLPAPALVVLAPAATLPVLAGIGVFMQARRRRFEGYC